MIGQLAVNVEVGPGRPWLGTFHEVGDCSLTLPFSRIPKGTFIFSPPPLPRRGGGACLPNGEDRVWPGAVIAFDHLLKL